MNEPKTRFWSFVELLASIVTLVVFLTGLSSLPAILQVTSPSFVDIDPAPSGRGILSVFDLQAQVAIALMSMPAFCMTNTWFLVAVSISFFTVMDRLGINAAISESLFSVLLLLPFAVGLNMIFMIVLFGTYLSWLPGLFGLASLAVIGLLIRRPGFLPRILGAEESEGLDVKKGKGRG